MQALGAKLEVFKANLEAQFVLKAGIDRENPRLGKQVFFFLLTAGAKAGAIWLPLVKAK